jgi:hypothetical protein
MGIKLVIFSLIISLWPLSSNDKIYNDIKTLSWKKINRNLENKKKLSKPEAFALAKYHEEYGYGKKKKSILLHYSLISGKKVSSLNREAVLYLLENPLKLDTVPQRISAFRLYKEINHSKLFSLKEKILFLEKFPILQDPIVLSAFEEYARLCIENRNYGNFLNKLNSLTKEEKEFFLSSTIQYYRAYSYLKLNKIDKAIKYYFNFFEEPSSKFKREGIRDLGSIYGKNFYKDLEIEKLGLILNYLDTKEQKDIISNNLIQSTIVVNDPFLFNQIVKFLMKRSYSLLILFLRNNNELTNSNKELISEVAEYLISSNDHKKALNLMNEFLKDDDSYLTLKNYARIYKKWNHEELYFDSLLKYLSKYPYDLTYNDYLIDYLAESKSNSVVYASEVYWEKAMNEIPDLPVKGRLVYWYLRFLKYSKNNSKLLQVLSSYYGYAPGSYYTKVIAEEFESEIKSISVPDNALNSKEDLFKYISIHMNKDFHQGLKGKDLKIAFNPKVIELEKSITDSHEIINQSLELKLSIEYIKIGHLTEAMILFNYYSKQNKLSDIDKNLILIGLGDLGNHTYLSLFHTRYLMKVYRIADDILFLPDGIIKRLYPRPHRGLVNRYSKSFQVDEEVIYAIMRQESFFREDAKSPANARGLMQVMPSTGRFLASKLGVHHYSLHDPEVSIQFGAKFLSDLLKNYNNELKWASIAYNGGPGNLRKWKRNHYKGDFNHFLEEMPSKESRDYCRIIVSNYLNYKSLTHLQKN